MKLTKKTVILGTVGLSGLGVIQADADTNVVYTHVANGNKDTKDSNGHNSQNDRLIQAYNDTVNQLRSDFPFIRVSDEPVSGDLSAKKQELDRLKPLLERVEFLYNTITTIKKQASQSGVSIRDGKTITSDDSNLRQKVIEFEQVINHVQNELNAIPSVTLDSNLKRLVVEANEQILKTSEINNHVEDGIKGNLDNIHRKAYDSAQPGTVTSKKGQKTGVVVNTDQTTRVNVVKSKQEVVKELVSSATDVTQKRDAILTKIANANTENSSLATKAGVYKDNALRNIVSINTWLQKEQDRADNIQDEIDKNMTAAKEMSKIQTNVGAKLDKAEQIIRSSGKSQKTIDKVLETINNARQKMSESKITQKKTDTINGAQNVDFGDIGRDESVIKGIEDRISGDIDSRVNTALDKLRRSNQEAQAKIDNWKGDIDSKINDFMNKVESGKVGGGQVDDAWLRTRPIYNSNSGGYQTFIKQALAQTEEDTQGVLTKSGNTWLVSSGTPTPKAAAALYNEKSAQGLDEGFGSVMLPSVNINDFVTVDGSKLANSQSFSGGAQGILDYMSDKSRMKPIQGKDGLTRFTDSPVYRDIVNQHINAVGNNNVLLVVSKKPTATFKLNDSFLYANEAGEFKTTDMSVKLTIGDGSGNDLGESKVNGGRTHMFYFYYMSVDASTGKLITGGGWFLAYDQSANSGNTNSGGSGTGELQLGNDSDSSDSDTLQSYMSSQRYFFPTPNTGNPYNTVGLSLSVDVKVNPEAGAYATNSPLYIADIDDGQAVNTGGDVVISNGSHPSTTGGSYVLSNTPSTGAHNGNVNLDEQAIMTTENGPISISKNGVTEPYQAIDIALFSPWGVIGGAPPKLELGSISHEVETFDIADPSAIAHTEGDYSVKKLSGILTTQTEDTTDIIEVPKMSVNLKKAEVDNDSTDSKQVASSTSIVVRRLADKINRVGSGNSFVVRQLGENKRVGSGNTLVVRQIGSDKKVGSGNTLVVREISQGKKVGSGNTLYVRTLQGLAKVTKSADSKNNVTTTIAKSAGDNSSDNDTATINDSNNSLEVKNVGSPVRLNKDVVTIDVQVDDTLKGVANEAIKDWQRALANHGVKLRVVGKTTASGLAILDADNVTTRAARTVESRNVENDNAFEMQKLAGLTTFTRKVGIVDLDSDDKLNKSGTFGVNDLKRTKMVVQINTDAIQSDSDRIKVIKHELGHVFGLQHNTDNPLMTPHFTDQIFTGEITDDIASLAAQNLRGGIICECETCMSLRK